MSIKQTDQVRVPTTQSTHINTPSSAAEELRHRLDRFPVKHSFVLAPYQCQITLLCTITMSASQPPQFACCLRNWFLGSWGLPFQVGRLTRFNVDFFAFLAFHWVGRIPIDSVHLNEHLELVAELGNTPAMNNEH